MYKHKHLSSLKLTKGYNYTYGLSTFTSLHY